MPDTDLCGKRLIFTGQDGGTCWFNAILISTLYSQKSRTKVMQTSRKWDTNIEIYNILNHILRHKYVKSKKPEKDMDFFNKHITPEYILKTLHKYDSHKFMLSDFSKGFLSYLYIRSFYELLGLSCLMLIVIPDNFDMINIMYDIYNVPPSVQISNDSMIHTTYHLQDGDIVDDELNSAPDILILRSTDKEYKNSYYRKILFKNDFYDIYDEDNINNLLSMNDTIIFNKETYDLDSVIVLNIDGNSFHIIAGVTCKGKRYVYNGWKNEEDGRPDKPCELMQFDWDVNVNNEFCLDPIRCHLHNQHGDDFCYSFATGDRILIYVKRNKSLSSQLSSPNYSITPEYVSYEAKTLNSKTLKNIQDKID